MRKLLPPLLAFFVLLAIFIIIILWTYSVNKSDIGVAAVRALYNFQSVEELDDNMEVLKVLTTDEVYEQLTIDKTDRALNVYLKFNNKPTVVEFEVVTDRFIIYKLNTESISSFRRFVFFYEVNNKGKISWVREGELLDFVDNYVPD